MLWLRRVRLDLASERDDVVVHDSIADRNAGSPDGVEKLLPAQNPALTAHEGGKQPELGGAEIHARAVASNLAAAEIDLDKAEADDVGIVGTCPSQHSLDTRPPFARVVGLRDVVIRAEFEPQYLLGIVRAGGEQDDRRPDASAVGVRRLGVKR